MKKITLQTLFTEIKSVKEGQDELRADVSSLKSDVSSLKSNYSGLRDDLHKLDAKTDVKFEFLKEQIKAVHAEMKTEFKLVRRDLKSIRDQTALTTERIVMLEQR